jgi:rhodanese-related sulfurtransferase
MRSLGPREVAALLERPQGEAGEPPQLLDCREPWEYEICRIEGSRLVPMSAIPQALGGLDRGREIVAICHHGIRSRQVVLYLERQGFTRVINLEGGLDAWARLVDPAMRTY